MDLKFCTTASWQWMGRLAFCSWTPWGSPGVYSCTLWESPGAYSCTLTNWFHGLRGLCAWPIFFTLPLGQTHPSLGGFVTILGGLMLLCKELIMVEGSQCIITWHMTTFLCSLGVVAGVVCCDTAQAKVISLFYFQDWLLQCMLFYCSVCYFIAVYVISVVLLFQHGHSQRIQTGQLFCFYWSVASWY